MSNNIPLLNRAKDVGEWLTNTKSGKVICDPGVLFSILHACIFSGSDSNLIFGAGLFSLGVTASVSAIRQLNPNLNEKISDKIRPILHKVSAPEFNSNGFPLFINGVILSGIALTAFAKGDYSSGVVALSFAVSNTDKGARISGEKSWTVENLGNKFFKAIGKNTYVENPPRFLKHTVYLPELWGSMGAFSAAFMHSGPAALAGGLSSLTAVRAAGVNNGDLKNPAIRDKPVAGTFAKLSDGKESPASDQVISRRFMKYASFIYSTGAFVSGNIVPAIGHFSAGIANNILEKKDRQIQQEKLNLS